MRRFVLTTLSAALVLGPAGLATAQASAATRSTNAVTVNWPVVKQGATGNRVRTIQYLLNQRGIRVAVDGSFGKSTTSAVKTFQKAQRLVVDGHVGPSTWQKLVVELRKGSRGDAVRGLQSQLRNQYGYKSVTVDGTFGATTEKAVKDFQAKRKLKADGIVGLGTWKALEAG